MSFWDSQLGEITGSADEAFAKQFQQIPDGSHLLAKIKEFNRETYGHNEYLEIIWQIVGSEFDGQQVRQKIRCWDNDPKKQHRAKSMFMYLHKLYNLQPANREPDRMDLMKFLGKGAGIVVQLTEPNDEGKQYNWVSEVHKTQGFETKVGEDKSTVIKHSAPKNDNFPNDPPIDNYEDVPF